MSFPETILCAQSWVTWQVILKVEGHEQSRIFDFHGGMEMPKFQLNSLEIENLIMLLYMQKDGEWQAKANAITLSKLAELREESKSSAWGGVTITAVAAPIPTT